MSWEVGLVVFFIAIPLIVCAAIAGFLSFWQWNCRKADEYTARGTRNSAYHSGDTKYYGVYYYNDEF